MIKEKVCKKCGKLKPRSAFAEMHKEGRRNGTKGTCLECSPPRILTADAKPRRAKRIAANDSAVYGAYHEQDRLAALLITRPALLIDALFDDDFQEIKPYLANAFTQGTGGPTTRMSSSWGYGR